MGEDKKIFTLYAHLDSVNPNLAKGMCVKKGDVLGEIGSTGYGQRYWWSRTTPHLHLEFKTANTLGNPDIPVNRYYGYVKMSAPTSDPRFLGYRDPKDFIEKVKVKVCT